MAVLNAGLHSYQCKIRQSQPDEYTDEVGVGWIERGGTTIPQTGKVSWILECGTEGEPVS